MGPDFKPAMRRRSTSEMEQVRKSEHEHRDPLLEEDEERKHSRDSRNSHESQDDIELSNLESHVDGYLDFDSTALLTPSEPPIPAVPKTKKSYIAIALALAVTVLGLTVNTESTAYFEDVLEYKKPFFTMYLMHSSLCLPWLGQLVYMRWKQRDKPYRRWVKDYNNQLREVITTIDAYVTAGPRLVIKWRGQVAGPLDFLASTMAVVTVVLTVSGCSWFLSLVMTTPSDLTAIYNCSTFFAAAFSVPLLKEKLGWLAISAVALSITGTFIIAYGDSTTEHEESAIGGARLVGNLVACIGAVAFGLYEVLFKKWACSSRPMEPAASLPLTFAASALTGIYTFATLWIGLVILHYTGAEPFEIPSLRVVGWVVLAVLSGSMAVNLLVVLVIWTDPIFGSMANVLSVFAVAIADWLLFDLSPSLATYIGGALIITAFGMLTKHTLGERKP